MARDKRPKVPWRKISPLSAILWVFLFGFALYLVITGITGILVKAG